MGEPSHDYDDRRTGTEHRSHLLVPSKRATATKVTLKAILVRACASTPEGGGSFSSASDVANTICGSDHHRAIGFVPSLITKGG